MWLRTLAGSRAGQIEDYTYEAGRAALANGFATRLEDVPPPAVLSTVVGDQPTTATKPKAAAAKKKR